MKKWHYIIYGIILVVAVGIFWLLAGLKQEVLAPAYNNPEVPTMISVTYPRSGDVIISPITLTGEARGNWYFEASFPIVIVDWDGRIIGQGHAEAQSDWMTTDFVPFKATISFERPEINDSNESYARRGAVIFKNDNPSGDPSRDMAVEIPVYFK
jgi:hypothetical protein